MTMLTWHNCYDGSWRDLIVAEAFAHPAKFAPDLVRRIYAHGFKRGWWKVGDLIGDPFGGIAGGGIMAGYAGLNWIGVELEPRFVELGNKNLALHGPKWMVLGEAFCVKLVQGDSRRFAEIVGAATGIVTSPPYIGGGHSGNQVGGWGGVGTEKGGNATKAEGGYGLTAGQIGTLPPGELSGVVTSPPYAETAVAKNSNGVDKRKHWETYRASGGGMSYEAFVAQQVRHSGDYGSTAGQIGALKSGELSGVITSPPYCDQFKQQGGGIYARGEHTKCRAGNVMDYGSTEGQLGNTDSETYWQAMAQVYGQCLLALRPGGHMAVVVKDYVKDKQRVPLCDQTLQLLTHLGFEPVERIHAMLVREESHECMFSGRVTKKKERKSFFRRLAEKKGSPRIDWEEVLVVRNGAA